MNKESPNVIGYWDKVRFEEFRVRGTGLIDYRIYALLLRILFQLSISYRINRRYDRITT